MRLPLLTIGTVALAGCQPQAAELVEQASNATPHGAISRDDFSTLIGKDEVGKITGTWRPYSRDADKEFGTLFIENDRLAFAYAGEASLKFSNGFALAEWRGANGSFSKRCDGAPPAAIEFRLSEKADYLAPDSEGQVLELTFYSSPKNIEALGDENLDLCGTASWDRD